MNGNNKHFLSDKFLLYFTLIVMFCNMVYWIFPFRPVVWRSLFVLCSIDVILFHKHSFSGMDKSVLYFVVLNIFYFIFSLTFMSPDYGLMGNILVAMLAFPLFSYFGQTGLINNRFLIISAILLIIGSIFGFYQMQEITMLQTNREAVTVNASAAFLMLLPMFMIIKNNWLKIIGFILCLSFIIAGAKRGNILAAIIPSLIFVFMMIKNTKNEKVTKKILVIIVIVFAGWFLFDQFLSNEFLMNRMEQTAEGDRSGRDRIYSDAWNLWFESDNLFTYIFGFGFDGTVRQPIMNGMRAHNDWLEILVNYGLVGVLFYLVVFVFFFKEIRITKNSKTRKVLLSAFFIWLFKTMYSMGFTEPDLSLLSISVGAVIGQRNRDSVVSPMAVNEDEK